MFDFLKLKTDIASIGAQARKLRGQIEQKKQERENLQSLPLPREDLKARLCSMVDKQGAAYPEKLQMALRGLLCKPLHDYENSFLDLVATTGASVIPGTIPKVNMMWFFGETIKDGLSRAIDTMDYPKAGPPLAERQPRIDALDKEIANHCFQKNNF